MTKASDNEFPSVLLDEQVAAPTSPSAGFRRVYAKSDGVYEVDSAGTETGPFGTGGGAGASYGGFTLAVLPVGMPGDSGTGAAMSASAAYWSIVNIPSPMYVRSLSAFVTGAGAGTVQWGLFDPSGAPTAATKVAGGSGALNASSDWVQIAATSAPVLIDPGSYVLILHAPAANAPSVARILVPGVGADSAQYCRVQTGYTWDDTPDLTSASWATNTTMFHVAIIGQLDATTQLPA